jgi:hypothetical protein
LGLFECRLEKFGQAAQRFALALEVRGKIAACELFGFFEDLREVFSDRLAGEGVFAGNDLRADSLSEDGSPLERLNGLFG